MDTKVSIVTINLNASNVTMRCLRSLTKQTFKKFEVIVIDNGSEKKEKDKLKRELKTFESKLNIRKIFRPYNAGACAMYNLGIKIAKGKFVAFLNNDTVTDKRWLENLIKVFDDKYIAVVSSKILFENGLVQYSGGGLTFFGRLTHHENKKSGECFWGHGAAYVIRKSALKNLDEYFPDAYFVYFDEPDLCWRLKNINYKVYYCDDSIVWHLHQKTTGKLDSRKIYLRNKYLTFWRNLNNWRFSLVLPFMIAFDTAKWLKTRFIEHQRYPFVLAFKEFLDYRSKVKRPAKCKINQLKFL